MKLRHEQGVVRTSLKMERREKERQEEERMLVECVKLDGEASGGICRVVWIGLCEVRPRRKTSRCPPMREIRKAPCA